MTDADTSRNAPSNAAVDQRIRPRSVHRAAVRGSAVPERSWTPVGTIDNGVLGHIDGAGAVQLSDATWSLDWWVGAEDRWHHPSREPSVRQRAIGDAPVLETALRVPGGDVVARAYGVRAEAGPWRGPAVVVEVENRTAVPVALAFVVRPLALDGDGALREVRSEGPVVKVDGSTALLLGRAPARSVSGALDEVAARLTAGDDGPGEVALRRDEGDVEAAFIMPLTHTATARVLLPVADRQQRGGPRPEAPWTAPEADAVAKGWSVHRGDSLRVVVPEPEWDEALTWADALLRLAGPDEVGACLDRRRSAPTGPVAAVRAAEVAEAMSRLGADSELAAIARGLAAAQRLGGEVRMGDRSDGTVALIHAIAGALADVEDPEAALVEELVAPAAVAIRRLGRGKGRALRSSSSPESRSGDDPSMVLAAVRGLRSLVPVLIRVGQPEVAADALAAASRLSDAPELGQSVEQSGPAERFGDGSTLGDARLARTLVAAAATGATPAALASVRHLWAGAAQSGRSDAVERRDSDGADVRTGPLGFDVAELAARTNALLDVVVADGIDGPVLLPAFDPSWAGQPVEAHGVATPWGSTSFALRWHGARPALLWEVEGSDGPTPTLTAPGLDPGWRGQGREGEALLAVPTVLTPVTPAAEVTVADPELPGEGDSFG